MRNPLPECIDSERLAASGMPLTGVWPAVRCQRLATAVHRVASDIELELALTPVSPGQFDMRGHIKVALEVICQRCLQVMPWSVNEPIQLRAVTAALAPLADTEVLELDPQNRIVTEQWLEDEVLLKLPLMMWHPDKQQCDAAMLQRAQEHEKTDETGEKQSSPFAILKRLKD